KGHQRGAIRHVANRAYALCPEILNDARTAPWAIDINPMESGSTVELRPRLSPDPRLYFRQKDVPAASHPPLAACMAWLAGKAEVVWDPFCGSGLEMIECGLRGGVRSLFGTDRSAEAIAVAQANCAAAKLNIPSRFVCCDFRDFDTIEGLGADSVDLIITNPPMGKRVPIHNLRGLIGDLFVAAATTLRPGGKLLFANPLSEESSHPSLKLQFQQAVDFGGFECSLEMYVKVTR
ncbi:MAG: methyltransferase, partial [Chthoniobacterales bacterium]